MDNLQFKNIRVAILKWGVTRLAGELGLSRNSIYRIESGEMAVELRTDLSMRWILFREKHIQIDSPSLVPPVKVANLAPLVKRPLRHWINDKSLPNFHVHSRIFKGLMNIPSVSSSTLISSFGSLEIAYSDIPSSVDDLYSLFCSFSSR